MSTPARRSVGYFPPGEEEPTLPVAGTGWFFVEDFHVDLMPYRSTRESEFKVELSPTNDDVAGWLAALLGARSNRAYELEDAVCDFVRDLGHSLALNGEVFFEITTASSKDPGLPNVALIPLPYGRVTRIASRYVQWVPRHLHSQLGRWVLLPANVIWHLRLPRELGSPRQHRRLVRRLGEASGISPPFVLEDERLGANVRGYDFLTYRRAVDAEVEHLTRGWGGIPRLRVVEGATEYYFFERHVQWRRSQALVREHIISEINRLLHRLGVQSRLVVRGLPSSTDLAELRDRLRRGEADFAKVREESRVP